MEDSIATLRPECDRRRGLTFVELLVVLAVVAMLTGIMLPVVSAARDRNRRTSCTNNLRQLVIAFRQYCEDYDEMAPPNGVAFLKQVQDLDRLWFRQILPYYRDPQILHCP